MGPSRRVRVAVALNTMSHPTSMQHQAVYSRGASTHATLANWFIRGTPLIFHTPKFDETGPLGRAIIVIIAAIAELERSPIFERVRVGSRCVSHNPREPSLMALT